MAITHCLYPKNLNCFEKNCEMELISPTQVVRQAREKIAARIIAPNSPKSWDTI